ncbi:Phosphoglycolate phosphatase [Pelomyxa schiedti]|nr:Phosphoglycolate phosphatase [Pelomyxa schiedti]
MSHGTAALKDMSYEETTEFLNQFDVVAFDLDGVLFIGRSPVPGAKEALRRVKELNKRVMFVSNRIERPTGFISIMSSVFDINVEEQDYISAARATMWHLSKTITGPKTVFLVGSDEIRDQLMQNNFVCYSEAEPKATPEFWRDFTLPVESVSAVLVGFDPNFSYPKLVYASQYLRNESTLFFATNCDKVFPVHNQYGDTTYPDVGCILAAVESSVGRKAAIIGKPEQPMARFFLDSVGSGTPLSRVLFIGDACSDIEFGTSCGIQTMLVLTGVTKPDDVPLMRHKPTYIAPSISILSASG